MPKIEKIVFQKKIPNYKVLLSEREIDLFSEKTISEFNIYKDKEIDNIEEIIKYDRIEFLKSRAIRYLGRRMRSEREIATKLKDYIKWYKIDPENIKKTLDVLKSASIINDFEFARWWVDNRMRNSSRSKIALQSELLVKGISKEIINEVLSNIDEEEFINAGVNLAQKKLKLKKFSTPQERKTYLIRYLAQKGYFSETIFKIIDIIENN